MNLQPGIENEPSSEDHCRTPMIARFSKNYIIITVVMMENLQTRESNLCMANCTATVRFSHCVSPVFIAFHCIVSNFMGVNWAGKCFGYESRLNYDRAFPGFVGAWKKIGHEKSIVIEMSRAFDSVRQEKRGFKTKAVLRVRIDDSFCIFDSVNKILTRTRYVIKEI